MYIETWYKVICPNCKKPNWLCDGDTSDCTAVSVEACECFNCDHEFWLSEDYHDEPDEDQDSEEHLADHTTRGMETPR